MSNTSMAGTCNAPFLPEANYPSTGGDIAARFCVTINEGRQPVSCCLPCPTTYWTFTDSFQGKVNLAGYLSILSLVLNVFLLATFLVLPREKSHRHYLSIGLTSSFILIAIAFVIPLGTKPGHCYNDITPHNEKTQASCAVTGVLVELGAMGAVVWILLRSLWTTMRITINLKHVNVFKNISIGLGIGLPILFMAISLPITSVSYSLGDVCVPSNPNAMQTWFAWLLVFTAISWFTQVGTIFYCISRFTSFAFSGQPDTNASTSVDSADIADVDEYGTSPTTPTPKNLTPRKKKSVAWKRARGILKLQWRSMTMAFIIVNLIIYFGMFFVQQSGMSRMQYLKFSPELAPDSMETRWIACLMANGGDKDKCLHGAIGLGLRQDRVEATLILASIIGIIVFGLMVRSSMFAGWWQLLRNPRGFFRRPSLENDNLLAMGGTRVEAPAESVSEKEREAEDVEHDERKRTSDTIVEDHVVV